MAEIVPLKLTPQRALDAIRRLSVDTARVVMLEHVKQRARARRITRRQIDLCLQKGGITEGPFMNQHGHWQVTMRRRAAGEEINCVVAIDWDTRLLVITAF